ncbi:MAG: ABC-F family ATP-binding cassette domain-containing protein, partial [Victivallales bacterium]|nr:ABC-F family ATP-binding cassette domain-containing protein [Victivallales bacterium]
DIKLEELERMISARDGWTLESRLQELCTSLDVPDLERRGEELSGGEKRRVALCRALIDRPELLLLDEPTNHLDTQTIEWLENYVRALNGTCLFVTHDRYFLDRICTRILELSHGQLYSYNGNYTEFLRVKAEREAEEKSQEAKRLSFIRREIDWIRRGPKARGTKSWSRIQRFEEAVNQQPLPQDRNAEMMLPEPEQLGNIIVRLQDVSLQRQGKWLFQHLNFDFQRGMRLGIIGRNGLGKTSLLKVILGELPPTSGTVRLGDRTRINYADQHRVTLNDEKTVVEDIGEGNDFVMFGNRKLSVWTYLKRFLFQDEEIKTQVGRLSGGEHNRLVLAKILKRGGNFLMLDEPTNDLDLATLRVLEETLTSFDGCVVVVSHDRYFLNRVCTDILAFEGNGVTVFQPGDYSYYVEKRAAAQAQQRAEAQSDKAKTAPPPAAPATRRPGKLKWKEQQELDGMEDAISTAEAKVAELETMFSAPDFHAKYGKQTPQLLADLTAANADVERLYARWDELESLKNG